MDYPKSQMFLSGKLTLESHNYEQETKIKGGRQIKRWSIWPCIGSCILLGYFTFYWTSLPPLTANDTSHITVEENGSLQSNYTCLPSQPCWPSTGRWAAFNRTVNGTLKLTVPWAEPCYAGSAKCQQVAADYMNSSARTSHYGAMEFLDWETCGQSSCMLNSFSPSAPVDGVCSLGRLSTYHVEAHTADDIKKTLDFVRAHNIRLSIKNSGHDYFGRSNAECT